MRKQAAFLFIPLFLAFGYFQEHRFPIFSFNTPNLSQLNNNNTTDPNALAPNDTAGSGWQNDAFSRIYHTNTGQESTNTNTTGASTDTASVQTPTVFHTYSSNSVNSTQNTPAPNTTPTNPAITYNQPVNSAPTPGVPNTGVESTSQPNTNTTTTVTPTPTNQNLYFAFTPATTFGSPPSSSGGLTIFPQPAPSQPLPAPTSIVNVGINTTTTTSTNASSTTPPPSSSSTPPSQSTSTSTTSTTTVTNASTTPASSSPQASTSSPTSPPPPPPPPAATTKTNSNTSATGTTPANPNPAPRPPSPPPPSPPPPAPQPTNTSGDVFSTGAVSFRFDDAWQSQYDIALPALENAGFKGTFYIVTRQLSDDGFTGFMSSEEVKHLASIGEDIGDHTQTHPHLPTLSTSQQQAEITGALHDLQAMGITPLTVSYPYGEYTAQTVQIVKDAGFKGAVSTIESTVSPSSDPFQLESPSMQVSNTPAEIEQMIQSAVSSHRWLIMTFHRIDTSGDQYSITPQNFKEVVNYVASHHIPVVTVSQGLSDLSK